MKIKLEQCNLKYFADIKGEKMEVAHPGILAKIFNKTEKKFLFFWWTSNAKENGIKIRTKSGEIKNASLCTEAYVRTKIKSAQDLKKAISYYYEKGENRKAEKIKLGDVVDFYDPEHKNEFNKNVPVFETDYFKKTIGFVKEEDIKRFCKKIALYLSKNVYKFYESPDMFGVKSINGTSLVTLTDEETKNLIIELEKRSL